MKLSLYARPNNWERFQGRKQNKLFKKVRAKVIREQNFTCQFCHFKTPYLEIVNLDHDYAHNTMNNFAAACVLCSKCMFMDAYKLDYQGSDKIIYLPEISQVQLLNLCRMLFCKTQQGGDSAYQAQMLLAQLQDRASWVDNKAQCALSNPSMFSNYLMSRKKDIKLVSQLKWLPGVDDYKPYLSHWQEQIELILSNSSH